MNNEQARPTSRQTPSAASGKEDYRRYIARKRRQRRKQRRLILCAAALFVLVLLIVLLVKGCSGSDPLKDDQLFIDFSNEAAPDCAYTFSVNDNTLPLTGGEGTIGNILRKTGYANKTRLAIAVTGKRFIIPKLLNERDGSEESPIVL